MNNINRVTVVVLDSVGAGELPDAKDFGDIGSNTLGNLAKATGGLNLPNMQKLGLGNITDIEGVAPNASPETGNPPIRRAMRADGRMRFRMHFRFSRAGSASMPTGSRAEAGFHRRAYALLCTVCSCP